MTSNKLFSFKDLVIKKSYTSKEDDISGEFFNPVLSVTRLYFRVSAYYSSRSLIGISEGLSNMISNGGEMKMIISFFVDSEDYEAYLQGRKDASNFIRYKLPSTKEEIKELMENNSVQAFCSLINTDRLAIKFVISQDGIFHEKYGIMFDFNNNFIGFAGSLNETFNGLINNFEKIKVFRGWIEEEKEYIEPDLKEFERFWNGNADGCIILDMPESTINLIKTTYNEFLKDKAEISSIKKNQLILRDYQQQAIYSWEKNDYRGIFAMATGTGKTKTAVACVSIFFKNNDFGAVVVAVPTDLLVFQWKNELYRHIPNIKIIQISGEGSYKIDDLYTEVKSLEKANSGRIIILGTYKMISSPKFQKVVFEILGKNRFLIADEVHHIAAEHYSNIMDGSFSHRLGLSATPTRYFDEEGSELIDSYFKGVVFTLTLEQAIRNHYLCEYNYYMYFTDLTQEEYEKYNRLTLKIVKSNLLDKNYNDRKSTELLTIQRARILKKAANKEKTLKSIINKLKLENKIKHLIVYFEDNEQIEQMEHIFDEFSISYMKIDASTDAEDRDNIISAFSRGTINCLLSMRILDEGVDVPAIERAIIVASSSNTGQFIQRRGRLLRKSKGKNVAEIYDILVLASNDYDLGTMNDLEKSIMEKELKRALIFSKAANNKSDCISTINTIALKYNLTYIDMED